MIGFLRTKSDITPLDQYKRSLLLCTNATRIQTTPSPLAPTSPSKAVSRVPQWVAVDRGHGLPPGGGDGWEMER